MKTNVAITYNVWWLGEVPPCRMFKFSTKACGGILPNHCYKPFFIRVWRKQFNSIKMTLEQKYKDQYEIGFPIFEKLFQLKKDDFIKVMKDIFQDNKSIMGILENKPRVIKTLNDDEPEEMQIHFYSSILINYTGVRFKPEHGSLEMILKFDKFFNVDVALNGL